MALEQLDVVNSVFDQMVIGDVFHSHHEKSQLESWLC
jgi:predicted nicotinamide N-methyase